MASRTARFRVPVIAAITGLAALIGLIAVLLPASAPAAPVASSDSAAPAGTPRATVSAQVQQTAVVTSAPAAKPKGTKAHKPKAATRTRKARYVPERPRDHHTGKRIVYDKALMTVWLMGAHDNVVARYPVVGRWDRPRKGTYHVLSKSPSSYNPESDVTFAHMVRFAPGLQTGFTIGFHAIPRYRDGTRMHSVKQLGLPIARGGCVRLSDKAAKRVYNFLDVGDLVVVLPSP